MSCPIDHRPIQGTKIRCHSQPLHWACGPCTLTQGLGTSFGSDPLHMMARLLGYHAQELRTLHGHKLHKAYDAQYLGVDACL